MASYDDDVMILMITYDDDDDEKDSIRAVTCMWVGYDWVQGKAGRGTSSFVFSSHHGVW